MRISTATASVNGQASRELKSDQINERLNEPRILPFGRVVAAQNVADLSRKLSIQISIQTNREHEREVEVIDFVFLA